MKIKLLSIVILVSTLNLSCINSKNDQNNENDSLFSNLITDSGKGEVIEKAYDLNFEGLEISTSLSAEIYKSDKEKIVVFAPSDLMKYVIVKNNGGKVQVKIETESLKSISTDRIKIKVYAKDFDHLAANSSGSIYLKDNFSFSDLDVKVSSSGTIKGNFSGDNISVQASSSGNYSGEVNAKSLSLQSSSSGDLAIKGKSKSANVTASSSGDINAENYIVESAVLACSSSADITIGVSKSVVASASSSGSILVLKKGSLDEISKNESSSGSVTIQ